jgi:hypothetical protein
MASVRYTLITIKIGAKRAEGYVDGELWKKQP